MALELGGDPLPHPGCVDGTGAPVAADAHGAGLEHTTGPELVAHPRHRLGRHSTELGDAAVGPRRVGPEDPTDRGAAFVEAQRQAVAHVAAHELDVGVVGRTVEEHGSNALETEVGRRGDAMLTVDDAAVGPAHDDRRPLLGHLGEHRHVRRVEATRPQRRPRLEVGEGELEHAMLGGAPRRHGPGV